MKCKIQISYINNTSQDSCYQIQLSIKNAVDFGVLTIHESNTPFPFTRHYFRMMCDRDILQLFFDDLNYAMSSLTISYRFVSSITKKTAPLTDIQYVHAVCF
jgi:hypothetical protein